MSRQANISSIDKREALVAAALVLAVAAVKVEPVEGKNERLLFELMLDRDAGALSMQVDGME